MRKRNSQLLITTIIVLGISASLLFGGFLGAGSYGYAQQYQFNISSDSLIRVLESFKQNNPSFQPPQKMLDSDRAEASGGFGIDIYENKQRILFVSLVEKNLHNPEESLILLISCNRTLDVTGFKQINRDLNRKENMEAKRIFEDEILNKLGLKYKDNGNGMLIFWK